MVHVKDILLLDNNTLGKLEHVPTRRRLKANLRITGREFWPTGVNVLEALKSRDRDRRTRLLSVLAELADDAHSMPIPTEALKAVADAVVTNAATITWSDPRLTALFRDPAGVTDELAAEVRVHLQDQERSFDSAHEQAKADLLPVLKAKGGRDTWPDVRTFLDEVWNSRDHLAGYLTRLWKDWGFPGDAPVEELLDSRAWQLYFDGWGAAMYARILAHPQPPKVEHADLLQLVYCGSARSSIIATDDQGFQHLANVILRRRYPRIEVVPLESMIS